ncbi:MAG: hypothetical protein ABSA76_09370 [Bacteroidales bacterium]
MNCKLLIILISALAISCPGHGQFNEKRSFNKSLYVNKDMSLDVNNKYGTIHITPWDKDSVSIRVEVEANSSNLERLHKMFNGININITGSSFQIRAESEFNQNIDILFESFKGLTSKLISYESRLQINYFISAPEYLDMQITNKYGDVYMENNTGKFSLSLSNGNFRANSLNESSQIEFTFCNATINKMKKGYINASFSDVEIGESQDIKISSISSKYDLKKIGKLDAESRRDKFYIGTASEIKGNSYFTDYRIGELEKNIDVDSRYGSLNADNIQKGLDFINIKSSYSDISLNFDPAASYNLDIRYVNAFLVLPDKNSEIEKKSVNEDKKEYMAFGTVGKNPGSVKVSIDATRGNIYIK